MDIPRFTRVCWVAAWLTVASLAAIGAAGCSSGGKCGDSGQLALVAYSVPKPAYSAL